MTSSWPAATDSPSAVPSAESTSFPSSVPSAAENNIVPTTTAISEEPSAEPSATPSETSPINAAPTTVPSQGHTHVPSADPSLTMVPTATPSLVPSALPTDASALVSIDLNTHLVLYNTSVATLDSNCQQAIINSLAQTLQVTVPNVVYVRDEKVSTIYGRILRDAEDSLIHVVAMYANLQGKTSQTTEMNLFDWANKTIAYSVNHDIFVNTLRSEARKHNATGLFWVSHVEFTVAIIARADSLTASGAGGLSQAATNGLAIGLSLFMCCCCGILACCGALMRRRTEEEEEKKKKEETDLMQFYPSDLSTDHPDEVARQKMLDSINSSQGERSHWSSWRFLRGGRYPDEQMQTAQPVDGPDSKNYIGNIKDYELADNSPPGPLQRESSFDPTCSKQSFRTAEVFVQSARPQDEEEQQVDSLSSVQFNQIYSKPNNNHTNNHTYSNQFFRERSAENMRNSFMNRQHNNTSTSSIQAQQRASITSVSSVNSQTSQSVASDTHSHLSATTASSATHSDMSSIVHTDTYTMSANLYRQSITSSSIASSVLTASTTTQQSVSHSETNNFRSSHNYVMGSEAVAHQKAAMEALRPNRIATFGGTSSSELLRNSFQTYQRRSERSPRFKHEAAADRELRQRSPRFSPRTSARLSGSDKPMTPNHAMQNQV